MVWLSRDEHLFQHPWEKVVEAAVRKYPNPEQPNVISTDVIERSVDDQGRLKSTRMITSCWASSTVKYIARFTGLSALLKPIHAIEFSTIDVANKKYELTSRNYNLSNYLTVDEHLTYTPHPTLENTTVLVQKWNINVKNLGFTSFLESTMGSTMKSMAIKGREGIEFVIDQLKEEVEQLPLIASEKLKELSKDFSENMDQVGNATKMWELKLHDELHGFIKSTNPLEITTTAPAATPAPGTTENNVL